MISNTPGAVDDATADVAMYLMLGAFRRSWVPSLAIRKGEWRGKTGMCFPPLLSYTCAILRTLSTKNSDTTPKESYSASSAWAELEKLSQSVA